MNSNFSITKTSIGDKNLKICFFENNQPLTWWLFFDLIKQGNVDLLNLFNHKLFSPDTFWELPPISKNSLNKEVEMVILNNPNPPSDLTLDLKTFGNYFQKNKQLPSYSRNNYWVSFPNLQKDAILFCPVPYVIENGKPVPWFSNTWPQTLQYVNLNFFVDLAPQEQKHNFWKGLSEIFLEQVNKNSAPRWLSTHGLGVNYLHVRIDTKPKYYSYPEYKNPNFYNKNNDIPNNNDNQNGNNNNGNEGTKNPVQNNQPTDRNFIILLITLFGFLLFFLVLKLRKRKKID